MMQPKPPCRAQSAGQRGNTELFLVRSPKKTTFCHRREEPGLPHGAPGRERAQVISPRGKRYTDATLVRLFVSAPT